MAKKKQEQENDLMEQDEITEGDVGEMTEGETTEGETTEGETTEGETTEGETTEGETTEGETTEGETTEGETAEAVAKPVKEKKPAVKHRVEGITNDSVCTLVAKSNPKREGSNAHDRFQNYFGLCEKFTVKEAIAAGLWQGDISYDFAHGHINVEGATVTEYTPTPRGSAPKTKKVESTDEDSDATDEDSDATDEAELAEETGF